MFKLNAIAVVMIMTTPLPAIAYSQRDSAACASDAQRLCQDAIPDEGRVSLCLHQNRRQLSPACGMTLKRQHSH
jgi:hypothetical protein